jgi:DeoR/GlpR family transcriptional regulator of sugar metabolism
MFLTMDELAKRTKYSKHTLYKKIKKLTNGVHYFKPNGGKIFFTPKAVDFLIKGGLNEDKQRLDFQKKREQISAYQFICER